MGKSKGLIPGGKPVSKAAQIFAALWIAALTVCKGLGLVRLGIDEIVYSGIALAAIFVPVYFSIWLDKIHDIRFGKTSVDGSQEGKQ
jgi:hypothetical protein